MIKYISLLVRDIRFSYRNMKIDKGKPMANSTKSQTKVVGTTIDAMIKEGKALATIWKQTNSLKASTKA